MPDRLETISGYLDRAEFEGQLGGLLIVTGYRGATEVGISGAAILDHDGVRRLIHALSTALPRDEHTPAPKGSGDS